MPSTCTMGRSLLHAARANVGTDPSTALTVADPGPMQRRIASRRKRTSWRRRSFVYSTAASDSLARPKRSTSASSRG